jgi:uncharacterized protein
MAFQITTDMHPTGFPPVAETLPAAVEKIVRELNPEKIILFGSYAYGNPTPDSDVDLLVIWNTTKSRRDRILDVSRLLYPRSFPVDIIVKTPEELKQELKTNFFIREIVNKGKVIYEQR